MRRGKHIRRLMLALLPQGRSIRVRYTEATERRTLYDLDTPMHFGITDQVLCALLRACMLDRVYDEDTNIEIYTLSETGRFEAELLKGEAHGQ